MGKQMHGQAWQVELGKHASRGPGGRFLELRTSSLAQPEPERGRPTAHGPKTPVLFACLVMALPGVWKGSRGCRKKKEREGQKTEKKKKQPLFG